MHMKAALFVLIAVTSVLFPLVSRASEPSEPARTTYLLIYRPGPAWPQGKSVSELPLREHGSYMLSLYEKGLMKQAGPLADDAGGAVVLEVSGEAQAREIVANDPAVKSGIFVHELHPWAPVKWQEYLEK